MSNVVTIRMVSAKEARERTEAIRKKFTTMQSDWWELGRMVRDALDREVPAALEMNAIDWLRGVVGESVAKVYRALRIVKALDGVPEESVKKLTEGKAYMLTHVLPHFEGDGSARREWVEKAIASSTDEFSDAVNGFIEEKTGHRPERRVQIKCMVDESVSKVWNDAEAKLARIMELDIEMRPGLRAQVFEAIASLILTTDEEILRAEMVGANGEAAEA